MTQPQIKSDPAGSIQIHTATLLRDYEVQWSLAVHTEEDLEAAIRARAIKEWRRNPAEHSHVETEQEVADDPHHFFNEEDCLVTDTLQVSLPPHVVSACGAHPA